MCFIFLLSLYFIALVLTNIDAMYERLERKLFWKYFRRDLPINIFLFKCLIIGIVIICSIYK